MLVIFGIFVTGDDDYDNDDFTVSNISRMNHGFASLATLEVLASRYQTDIQQGGRSVDFQVGAEEFQPFLSL